MARSFPPPVMADLARYAAALAVAAGLIHVGVAPEHFAEAFEFGLFMVVVGAAQIAAGIVLLVRPSRALVVAAILGTVLVFVVYGVSRTTGLPFGPEPGHPEAVQAIDVISKAVELALLLALLYLKRRGLRAGSGAPAADDARAAGGTDGPPPTLHRRLHLHLG